MADVETLISAPSTARLNVADRLAEIARQHPNSLAVACPAKWSPQAPHFERRKSGAQYATTTFAELNADVDQIARGLAAWGVPRGTRLALLVRPGIEFVALVFAILRAGMVIVLVDPGLGRKNLVRCLAEAEPAGFVAIGLAQAARVMFRRKFPRARWNVTVGKRWFWGGLTLKQLRALGQQSSPQPPASSLPPPTSANDPAAIIFTSGSTGPPKGVLYTQRMFDTQVTEIQAMYGIATGGIDLGCFPLFALFNSAMGVTTVFPEMDFSRPASASPEKLLTAANDWSVTQAFASPAVWRVLSAYCAQTGARIPSLTQVFSCGAPVPADVLRATLTFVGNNARMHTPYGATECLPVSTMEAADVLGETAARTDEGAGVCVGRKFDSVEWRIIRITDEPISSIDDAEELPTGEIGELIVRGPQVSPRYVTRSDCNATAKIPTQRAGASPPPSIGNATIGEPPPTTPLESPLTTTPWHRTGDVGYFDNQDRFWYCGRKSHRVETSVGTMYTEIYEGIFNKHPKVHRSALVGVGPRGNQQPVMILECKSKVTEQDTDEMKQATAGEPCVPDCEVWVVDWPLPVDIRHNAKINREKLAEWAATELGKHPSQPPSGRL